MNFEYKTKFLGLCIFKVAILGRILKTLNSAMNPKMKNSVQISNFA